jgi:SAM-dependent methyltransferase
MDTFYTDHWQTIEPERLNRYERLFEFRPEQEPFVEALALSSKTSVLDFGCGPGFMAEEIASRTTAQVFGVDLNKEFMSRAQSRNTKKNLSFFHLASDALPAEIDRVDRVFIKNVLEYVPDLEGTVARLHGTLGDGGRIVVIDSDWGFVLVEPWGKVRTDRFFEAAAAAFREPHIGRKLPGLLARAGFKDVNVKMIAGVDLKGRGVSVLQNMVSYIRKFGTMTETELQAHMDELEAAQADGSFMFILPQFVVTATKGNPNG